MDIKYFAKLELGGLQLDAMTMTFAYLHVYYPYIKNDKSNKSPNFCNKSMHVNMSRSTICT